MKGDPVPRAMKDRRVREARHAELRLPHVAPLTDLVDRMRAVHGDLVPYVDPHSGGRDARVLLVLTRPGPKARESGFLSLENHDRTARNCLELLAEASVPPAEVSFWNIVPWYGARRQPLTAAEVSEGVIWLIRFLGLLPRLRALLLVGKEAQAAEGRIAFPPSVRTFRALHASPTNLNCNPGQREEVLRGYRAAWAWAAGGVDAVPGTGAPAF